MSLDPAAAGRLGAPVRVVGTGLLGASVALGLRASGVRVLLADPSPTALELARDLGAGEIDRGDVEPALVVVACPPDVTAQVVASELERTVHATVTDVASVKSGLARALAARSHAARSFAADGSASGRYVGGHPMAGRERSGPVAARGDLFLGRPWVVCPTESCDPSRVEVVRALALALGATPVVMSPDAHDEAVALVSHLPQVAASLVAARLRGAADSSVALAGQGLRDLTRIAGSDPMLWAQILSANAGPVRSVLTQVRADLDGLIDALARLESPPDPPGGSAAVPGALAVVAALVAEGNAGRERVPGKHGSAPTAYRMVTALLPDRPGQLARLFQDIGDAGINVEEFALEHAPGQMLGLAQICVLPAAREHLERALLERGWRVVAS